MPKRCLDDKDLFYEELYREFIKTCGNMRKSICWSECYAFYSQMMGALYFACKTDLIAVSSFNSFHMALADILEDRKTWFMLRN